MSTAVDREHRLALLAECYTAGIAILPYPPPTISIEPTNHCNLRCPMCPVSQNYTAVDRGFMSFDLFCRIADEIGEYQPDVVLNLGGESLLHHRLPEMIHRLVQKGIHVSLDTNATRLTSRKAQDLVKSGLSEIVLCIDGHDAASYERTRVGARFEDTVQKVAEFLETRDRLGSSTPRTIIKNIQDYDSSKSLRFPPELKRFFHHHPPDEYRSTWKDQWPGDHRELLDVVYDVEPYTDEYEPCINLWRTLAISWDGMVHICALDLKRVVPIVNVSESGVAGAWNHPLLIELRTRHAQGQQGELALCHNCNQIRRRPADTRAGLDDPRKTRFTVFAVETPNDFGTHAIGR